MAIKSDKACPPGPGFMLFSVLCGARKIASPEPHVIPIRGIFNLLRELIFYASDLCAVDNAQIAVMNYVRSELSPDVAENRVCERRNTIQSLTQVDTDDVLALRSDMSVSGM